MIVDLKCKIKKEKTLLRRNVQTIIKLDISAKTPRIAMCYQFLRW